MPQVNITVSANSEIELLTRQKTVEKINEMPTDKLKRLLKLIESDKAQRYLSNDIQFAILQKFL